MPTSVRVGVYNNGTILIYCFMKHNISQFSGAMKLYRTLWPYGTREYGESLTESSFTIVQTLPGCKQNIIQKKHNYVKLCSFIS